MGHRVHGPGHARVGGQRAPAGFFGLWQFISAVVLPKVKVTTPRLEPEEIEGQMMPVDGPTAAPPP
jgi:hypothetical protein